MIKGLKTLVQYKFLFQNHHPNMLKKFILPGRPKEAHHRSARTSYEVSVTKYALQIKF
jgi:hypothetical protein